MAHLGFLLFPLLSNVSASHTTSHQAKFLLRPRDTRNCKGGDQRPFTQCVKNYPFWAMIASLTGVGYTGSLHYIQGGGNMVQGCDKRPLLLWLLVWNSLLLPVLVSTVSNKPFLATLGALTSPLSVSWSVHYYWYVASFLFSLIPTRQCSVTSHNKCSKSIWLVQLN